MCDIPAFSGLTFRSRAMATIEICAVQQAIQRMTKE
jgi:hypothetical protein